MQTLKTVINVSLIFFISSSLYSLEPINDKVIKTYKKYFATKVLISPSGKHISSIDGSNISIFETDQFKELKNIPFNEHVRTFDFDQDQYLYVGGNYNSFSIEQISLSPYYERKNFRPKTSGTIKHIQAMGDGSINLICSGNKFFRYSIKKNKFISKANIYGGFVLNSSHSKDLEYTAVTSQNDVNNYNVEPCKLTIFNSRGISLFTYTFKNEKFCHHGYHGFDDKNNFYLINKYHIKTFAFNKNFKRWIKMKDIPLDFGTPGTLEITTKPTHFWLGYDKKVIQLSAKGKVIKSYQFTIGKDLRNIRQPPIKSISVNQKAKLMAIGCTDGTVRITSLKTPTK